MKRKAGRRGSAKKKQIVSTGEALFSRYGIKRVTVEEICREAGVSKMTFYKYFPNKLELFKHIWTSWSDSVFERLTAMEKEGSSFMERMKAIVDFKMEMVSRTGPDLIEDMINSGPELGEFIRELRSRSVSRFFELVKESRENGEMRDIRPEFLLAVLDHLGQIVEDEGLRRLYSSDMEFIREINDFFFFGIMPAEASEVGKD